MLADQAAPILPTGALASDLHLPGASRLKLLDFIAQALPRWRDDPERPSDPTSETLLSEHLCDYLTGQARFTPGFDCFQFRTETGDEGKRGRKIDLAVKPCGVALWIEGKRHTQYEAIMPIECKRLPTPKAANRDEREYVIVGDKSTGGIQRFKFGDHGSTHKVAAMIAYIQEHDGAHWNQKIMGWMQDLFTTPDSSWTSNDLLKPIELDSANKTSRLLSSHSRGPGKDPIELHHLWVQMN
jgi:hypothetical protein